VSFGRLAPERLHAFDYLRSVSNLPAAHLAIASQACGMNCSYVSAGIAGAEAIGEAYLAVRDGLVRLALAGGADCWLTPYAAWRRPLLGGAPAVSEGAGVLLLEPLDAARARRAHMYGEITGYAKTLDAHGFPQSTSGEGLVRCVRAALERAATDAADVDYLGGQGGGGPEADRIESRALDVVFAPGPPPPGGSARRLVGHAGAASGALDAAVTLLAIERQRLPGPDGADEMARRVRVAVNVAFHPLGLSAALVFKRTCERPSPRGAST
jgi:3-oxoacyl-(acyl-carrier-protein) synthase